ncbi:MAG: hypothetical protein GX640_14155, partial [Fibrobacter sp.]|nr:hypothetical protein [Fibrobacter sp.]
MIYSPLFNGEANGTNINNAFLAAQQAFASSKNGKERQFIIFLSDGEPYPTTGANLVRLHGGKEPNWFEEGVNTPTTFTVYLHRTETTAPASMQRMTTNIQNNGYSSSNPMSKIWRLNTDYSSLMSLLMTNVIQPITSQYTGSPVSMVFNQVVSNKPADAIFQFSQNFPLKSDTTNFTMSVSYEVQDKTTGEKSDTVSNISFNVIRTDKVSVPTLGTVNCYDRDIELRFNGNPITSVNETMNELEVVFTAAGGNYTNVDVEIKNADNAFQDIFTIPLTYSNNTWTKKFFRTIASPVLTDQQLQHQSSDSIIIIYRNPAIPLDTIRKSYLFSISKTISLNAAAYYDKNADGFIDSIFIAVSGSLIQ